jgi:nucleoside phosphorylase
MEGNQMRSENSVDIVIITALQLELNALLQHFDVVEKVEIKSRFFYRTSVISETNNKKYSIVILTQGGMGNVESATATTQAIDIWNPNHIILTGICAGIPGTNEYLGDIVVGEQIVDYELSKVREAEVEHRYEVFRSSFPLISTARNLDYKEWAFSSRVPRPDGTTGRIIPKVHFGVVASGQKVIARESYLSDVRKQWSKLVAIEMEGIGVALASFQSDTAPKTFLVKGISDWGDGQKNDLWQEYAADIAATYVIAILKVGSLEPKDKEQETQAVRVQSQTYSRRSRIKLCRRLGEDWKDLADYFDIPPSTRATFDRGRECQSIWDWLDARNKLDGLEDALKEIGRTDVIGEIIKIDDGGNPE